MEQENTTEEVGNDNLVTVLPKKDPTKFKFWTGVLIALALIGAQFLAAILAGIVLGVTIGVESESFMPLMLGATLVIAFPLAVLIVLRKRKMEATAWKWDNRYWVLLPISFFMVFGASYILGAIMEMLPNYEAMMEQYSGMFEGLNETMLLIGGGIIGPICEEIIFRGIILAGFLKTYGYKKAILFSAIIFSVIHMVPIQMIATFFIGIILGYIYYKTRSLWLVSIIHIINNLAAFVVGGESMVMEETTREWFGSDALFFGSLVLSAIVIYVCYVLFEKLHGPAVEVAPQPVV